MGSAGMSETRGVLVMAYGTPKNLAEVEAYYTDIRHGHPPDREQLQRLVARYEAIGGHSPLLEITMAQARGIEERTGIRTFIGCKHAAPFIPDAIAALKRNGVTHAVGLVLAPHFSALSIGDYERRVLAAADAEGWNGTVTMVESWHFEQGYVDFLARRVIEALTGIDANVKDATVIFSAHSLPETILEAGDPYPHQLKETAQSVAAAVGLADARVAWQSASQTDVKWLGPDVTEVIRDLAAEGVTQVIVCPCGFVADHLEVLYDIDVEAQEVARAHGITLARTTSPNADPDFLDVLAEVVTNAFEKADAVRK
jgi:protoporphyrin/coproporphyrin ferrochelatase